MSENGIATGRVALDGVVDGGYDAVAAVCKALAGLDASIGRFIGSQLEAVPPLHVRDLAGMVVRTAGDLEFSAVLFVDDLPDNNSDAEQWLRHLIVTMPPSIHWAVASRDAPAWALGRMRASGDSDLVGAEQLSFSPDEVRNYLELVDPIRLGGGFAQELAERTKGWVMGVQMGALDARPDRLPSLGQRSLVDRGMVSAYFEDAVLDRLPDDMREFLFVTAWLQPFSAELAAAAGPFPDAGAILDRLLAKNLFVAATEPTNTWFRYHPIFLEFLQSRSARLRASSIGGIHERAGNWFEQQGMPIEALGHAFLSGNLERAQRLVEESLDRALSSGQIGLATEWLAHLDEPFISARPAILRSVIWTLIISYRLEEAAGWVLRARALLEEPGHFSALPNADLVELRLHLRAAQLIIQRSLNMERPDPQSYVELLGEVPDRCLDVRAILQIDLGGVYLERGELNLGLATYRAAQANCAARGFQFGQLNALSNRATILHLQGRLSDAEALCGEALALCLDEHGRPIPMAGWAYLALSEIHFERNEIDQARRAYAQAEDLVHQVNHLDWTVRLLETQAALVGLYERPRQGSDLLCEAEQLAIRRQSTRNLLRLRARLGEVAAFDRDMLLARQYFEAVGLRDDTTPGPAPLRTLDLRNGLHFAVYLILSNQKDNAAKWLRSICNAAQAQGFKPATALSALLLASLYDGERGAQGEVDRLLKLGLAAAQETQIVRLLTSRSELIRPVIQMAIERLADGSGQQAYAGYLLDVMNDAAPTRPPLHGLSPAPVQDASGVRLTTRETDILTLIPLGLRNRQISERLGIAETTLRWHITNLYEKLQISTRTQAVREARRRGLAD